MQAKLIDLKGQWEIRKGFEKEWLEKPASYEWKKIDIPKNLFQYDEFKRHTGPVTLKKNIENLTGKLNGEVRQNRTIFDGRIVSHETVESIAIRSGMISEIAYFYLDDEFIGSLGNSDPYETGFEREFLKILPAKKFEGKKNLFVIVYNYDNFLTFGLLGPKILAGDPSYIFPDLVRDFCLYFIIAAVYLVFAFIHIFTGLRVRKEFYNFYFGVFCMALAFFSLANLTGKDLLFSGSIMLRIRIDSMVLPVMTSSFLLFISYFFYKKHGLIPLIRAALCGILFIFNSFLPVKMLKYTYNAWMAITVCLCFSYTIFNLIRLIFKKNMNAILISIGTILLVYAAFHDMLATAGILKFMLLSPYFFLIFNIELVLVLTNRFFVVHKQLELLNVSLEKKVEERTGEILLLNEELTRSNEMLLEKNTLLSEMAEHDSLTGLLNHRAFHERLKEVFCEAVRFNFQFTIIMIDIDNFKFFNDRFGHQTGDRILLRIADILKESMRIYDIKTKYTNADGLLYNFDITGRYGGDEFCIILPHCSGENAQKTAERILALINEIKIKELDYTAVTSSLGIAVYDPLQKCDDEKRIIKLADDALYLAKNKGRNRIEILYF